MTAPVQFMIGNSIEFASFAFNGRTHPDCADYWDGNWVRTLLEVKVGGFRARINENLRVEEIISFLDEVKLLYQANNGVASFQTMEGWIDLRMEADGKGHIKCNAVVVDDPGIGNRLSFALHLDQTFLPPIIASLDAFATEYPLIGKP